MMEARFKEKSKILDVGITAVGAVFSVGTVLYGVWRLGLEPINEYTNYLLTEIWIRPTITYGLVACFVSEAKENR